MSILRQYQDQESNGEDDFITVEKRKQVLLKYEDKLKDKIASDI